ncbi:hypothetical protein MJO47_01895 [Desulfuromonas sp. KJ2020]|nr:hypothetical protein [Desulfuromonas sp. KJ2020]MCP3175845.1 hypothetical protein [Desulfuromonas sp. KJ2020]
MIDITGSAPELVTGVEGFVAALAGVTPPRTVMPVLSSQVFPEGEKSRPR